MGISAKGQAKINNCLGGVTESPSVATIAIDRWKKAGTEMK